jgi:hypothetical protein
MIDFSVVGVIRPCSLFGVIHIFGCQRDSHFRLSPRLPLVRLQKGGQRSVIPIRLPWRLPFAGFGNQACAGSGS